MIPDPPPSQPPWLNDLIRAWERSFQHERACAAQTRAELAALRARVEALENERKGS